MKMPTARDGTSSAPSTKAEIGAPLDLATGVDFNVNYASGYSPRESAEMILRTRAPAKTASS